MEYSIIKTLHVLFAGIWLIALPVDLMVRKYVRQDNLTGAELYLKLGNLLGIIGLTGILITGVYMSVSMEHFGFFRFATPGQHWLYTKQFLMVIMLIVTFAVLIPQAKKLRASLTGDASVFETQYRKMRNFNLVIHILVFTNFLLALSRYFMN